MAGEGNIMHESMPLVIDTHGLTAIY